MTRKEIKLQSKPWINFKITKLIKYHDRLKRRMIRKRTLDNEYLYKKFRNRVANEIKASKKSYYYQFFSEHKGNMKMLWSGIRSFINNNKKRSHTQLDSRKQVIAFQDRVMTINIKEAQHPLKREKQVIDKSSIMLKISTKSMHQVLV